MLFGNCERSDQIRSDQISQCTSSYFVANLYLVVLCQDLHDWGSELVTKTITELRGYYVKTGQVR